MPVRIRSTPISRPSIRSGCRIRAASSSCRCSVAGTQFDDDDPANDFPNNSRELLLASTSATQTQGIGFYVSEDGGGNASINQFTFTEGTAGLNGPLTINTPTALETGLIGPGLEYFASFTNNTTNALFNNNGAAGASYGLAWAQYSGGTLTADFQIFAPNGTAEFANPIQIFNFSGLASENAAPAWFFRNAGTATRHHLLVARLRARR